jgi:multimeric flavodoxin WrbA
MQSIEQIDLIQTIEEIFMNTCVAYFSKSGNIKIAAEYLAEKIGAKVIALSDGTNYKGLIGFMKGGMNASLTRKAKLDSATFDEIAKYERIVLATPVWAGKTTPAINAVLENVDFTDKQVYVMTMQADPDCKDAGKRGEFYKEAIGAKAIALSDGTNYNGLIGFMKGGMNASLARKAKLDSKLFDEISKYERIVLATPVWAGKTTPAINAVLENVDFTGKQVYVMTMQADPDCKDADKREEFYKEAINAKKGQFMALFAMHGNAPGKLTARELIIKRVDETVKLDAAS